MWLVTQNKCWTADKFEKRGLPHPAHCPICDQKPEMINHLLVGCVFAQVFWFLLACCSEGLGCRAFHHSPQSHPLMLGGLMQVPRLMGKVRQGLNSMTILGAWSIWNLRNRCFFYEYHRVHPRSHGPG